MEDNELDRLEDIRGDLDDTTLLQKATRDWDAAVGFMETNAHPKWLEAIKLWEGKHLTTQRAGRSKLFLRKPRNIVERIKAGLLGAFFSSENVVSVVPRRESVPTDVYAAKFREAYLNYRLNRRPIEWFKLCYSAFDDLGVHNVAIFNVEWRYEIDRINYQKEEPLLDEMQQPVIGEDGQPVTRPVDKYLDQVVRDEPEIKLVPPERMFIDPRVDWTDPYAGQYMFHQDYLTYQELKQLAMVDSKIDLSNINYASLSQYNNVVATQRFKENTPHVFDDPDRLLVEVRKYWYRVGAKWWHAWLLEDRSVIRAPQINPYQHGMPPYVYGFLVPESHLFYSDSTLNIHRDYFVAINGIRNQRFDNVALIMNKHFMVSRQAKVDLASLVNRRPGGVTLVDGDARTAVYHDEIPDLSPSAYNEEVLLDRELQEGTGVTEMSQGVQSGEPELATQTAIREKHGERKESVNIRIVAHSLILPTLEMLMAVCDQFETDAQVLQIVGEAIGLGGKNDQVPSLADVRGQYAVRVDAGLGAMSRDEKLQQLDVAVQRISAFFGMGATLPLWPEYLSALGIHNVKEVLAAIQQGIVQQQQLQMMEMMGAQGKTNGKSGGLEAERQHNQQQVKMPGRLGSIMQGANDMGRNR